LSTLWILTYSGCGWDVACVPRAYLKGWHLCTWFIHYSILESCFLKVEVKIGKRFDKVQMGVQSCGNHRCAVASRRHLFFVCV